MGEPLFEHGELYATKGALEVVSQDEAVDLVRRHITGDWGDVEEGDRLANERAVFSGQRVFCAYLVRGRRVWVITEAKDDDGVRAMTTVLLPDEY